MIGQFAGLGGVEEVSREKNVACGLNLEEAGDLVSREFRTFDPQHERVMMHEGRLSLWRYWPSLQSVRSLLVGGIVTRLCKKFIAMAEVLLHKGSLPQGSGPDPTNPMKLIWNWRGSQERGSSYLLRFWVLALLLPTAGAATVAGVGEESPAGERWSISGRGWGIQEQSLRWDLCFGAISWEVEPMGRWVFGREVAADEDRPLWLTRDAVDRRVRKEGVWITLGVGLGEAIPGEKLEKSELRVRHDRWLRSNFSLSYEEAKIHLAWLKRDGAVLKDLEGEGDEDPVRASGWVKMGPGGGYESVSTVHEVPFRDFVRGSAMGWVGSP